MRYQDEVIRFLRGDWAESDGSPLSEDRAKGLLLTHYENVERGMRLGSCESYVADEIGKAEGLHETLALTTAEEERAEREAYET